MEATFCQEERYECLTIFFETKEERIAILDAVDNALKELSPKPEIYIKMPSPDHKGEINIEFEDDYDREAEAIVQDLARILDLTFAPCHTCC